MLRRTAQFFGHLVDIMGHDQVEADYHDIEVARARVVTVNPVIYDVGGFESAYIPKLIARGEAVMEECLRGQGLRPEFGRGANLYKLFPPGRALLRYPAKDSPAFEYWAEHPLKSRTNGNAPTSPLDRATGTL